MCREELGDVRLRSAALVGISSVALGLVASLL